MRDQARAGVRSWRGRSRLSGSKEPDVTLDPKTPGSRPEPNADTQPLSDLGALTHIFLRLFTIQISLERSSRIKEINSVCKMCINIRYPRRTAYQQHS